MDELNEVEWLPADIKLVEKIKDMRFDSCTLHLKSSFLLVEEGLSE